MMLSETLRCAAGMAADAPRLAPRTDPEFGQTTWLSGARPGALLAAQRIHPIGLRTRLNPADVWRIEYVTSDRYNRILSATGAVFRSRTPWKGRGERPTVAFAPSTQGVAPRCDPSYSCTVGVALRTRPFDIIAAYEQPAINLLVAAGANVVLTDYPRDPEDNVQLYCDHVSAARALADAVRAAGQLGIWSNAVGLWGFSQGGGAIGGWLEQPEYAPEIQPAAAVVGAPPADLIATLQHTDRAIASVVILYAVAGMMAASPAVAAELAPILNPKGLEIVLFDSRVCAIGAITHRPWSDTSTWTTSGRALAQLIDELPETSQYLECCSLGQRRPLRVPIRLWSSPHDDIVPYTAVRNLAEAWGISLETRRMPRLPRRTGVNHFGPYYTHLAADTKWLLSHLGR